MITNVLIVMVLVAAGLIYRKQVSTMAAIDDLKAAVARVGASTSAEIKAVADKLASITPDDSAAIQEAVTSLNATADALDAETASLTAPATPPADSATA